MSDEEKKPKIPETEEEVVDMAAVRAMIKTGNGGNSKLADILQKERERKEKLAAKREARRKKKRGDAEDDD